MFGKQLLEILLIQCQAYYCFHSHGSMEAWPATEHKAQYRHKMLWSFNGQS